MFKKKKELSEQVSEQKVTENAPENETDEQKFEKNIKLLWIYTTLFCLFALMLIVVSSVIQGKINSDAEYYQGLYEGEKTSSQSTIQNIQTENASLKDAIEKYKKDNAALKEQTAMDKLTIADAATVIENYEYLMLAQNQLLEKDKEQARATLEKVDTKSLSEQAKLLYDSLAEDAGL